MFLKYFQSNLNVIDLKIIVIVLVIALFNVTFILDVTVTERWSQFTFEVK